MTARGITRGSARAKEPAGDLGSLAIVGTCWRRVGVDALTRFTLSEEARGERLRHLAGQLQVSELVYLATCNRVEVIFRQSESPASVERPSQLVFRALTGLEPRPGEVERSLRSWSGEAAIEHLFLVCAGLDSAQVGEREIQGQLRAALRAADGMGLSGPLVSEVLGEAQRVARWVHRRTGVGRGRLSLAEIGLDYLRDRLAERPGPVALVGVSAMTRRCAHALAEEGVPLVIVNRTAEKAAALASELQLRGEARWRSLDDFRRSPDAVAALLLATSSTQPVLDHYHLERLVHRSAQGTPLVVDMAVPPDVDPGTARALGIVRVGMAEITAEADACREQRLEEAAPARALVIEGVANMRRRRTERLLAPVIARLQERYHDTVVAALEELARNGVSRPGASSEDIERWTAALARRLSHIPTVGLRALASEAGAQAVRAFLASDPELLEHYLDSIGGEGLEDGSGDEHAQKVSRIEARR